MQNKHPHTQVVHRILANLPLIRYSHSRKQLNRLYRRRRMKIYYIKESSLKEEHVDVHYRQDSETIEVIRNFFSSLECITGKKDGCMHKLYPGSIYYLEVVDRKLFACQEKEVFQLDCSLKSFLDCYSQSGFIQIGKSTAVNIYKVERVTADLNMRLRLVLENGEALILNRSYKKIFMDALHRIREVCNEAHK